MHKKPLNLAALTLMNIVTVGSLQMITSTATYGSTLFFLYALATLTYFIPSILMTAELATRFPVTGGAYIWVERAFGKKTGFFAVSIFWFSNLIYYPTIFSLIATGALYLINPELVQQKSILFLCITGIFWFITLLNCLGIRVSSLISSLSCVVGILLPTLIILALAGDWLLSGKPSQISFAKNALLPDFGHFANIAFLSQVIISLAGMELSAAHAGDVVQPRRSYPLALLFSAFFILLIVIGAALGIAIVIPSKEIGLVSGLLDAFQIFMTASHWGAYLPLVFAMITLGNLGFASSWMIGSTRAMFVACQHSHAIPFMQKTNRFQAPVGVLVCEACIFTLASFIFWLMPSVNASYWVLLILGCQISFIYNILLFLALGKLKAAPGQKENYFVIPGGKIGRYGITALGSLSSLFAIVVGFFPPQQMSVGSGFVYAGILVLGIICACILPFIILRAKDV